MPHAMTPDEIRTFLTVGTRTGKLATIRKDGSPHVVPVWFVLDGDDVVFMTGAETAKGKAMRRDPRVALSVDLPEPPYGFVSVSGAVTLSDDLDAMLPFSIAMARRYMGDAQAEEYGRRNAVAGELLVRLTPSRVIAYSGVAD